MYTGNVGGVGKTMSGLVCIPHFLTKGLRNAKDKGEVYALYIVDMTMRLEETRYYALLQVPFLLLTNYTHVVVR